MDRSVVLKIGIVGVLAVVVLQTAAILILNSGHLVFTLDDAYIHLAIAENIAHGHYGVNPGEFSAPASSILWPLLIAPASGSAFAGYFVLLLNAACALLTVYVIWRILSVARVAADAPPRVLLLAMISLIIACNLVGLVFTGMEHSLQILITSMLVLGLICETERHAAPWWLLAAVVVAPLIRFEDAFLAAPAIVYLFVRGHRMRAAVCAVLITAAMGSFMAFLAMHHAGIMPTSVMAKSGFSSFGGLPQLVVRTFLRNLDSTQGVLLACTIPILAIAALSRDRPSGERLLAAAITAAIVIHLSTSRTGSFGRYESYIWSTALLLITYLYGGRVATRIGSYGAGRAAVVTILVLAVTCVPYIGIALLTPLASNNIYEQQYQMHRFATEYVDDVVAVNDLGWVSYRNPHYVLDLAGLASREALLRRRSGAPDWMQSLTQRYGVKAAMIYDDWFPSIPDDWTRIGELRLGKPRIAPARAIVGIYAVDPSSRDELREELVQFSRTVPKGVEVRVAGN